MAQERIVGQSAALREAIQVARKAANADDHVLLLGESGTGKGLLAYEIHAQGLRKEHEFVRVNCAALVDTLLESELFGHVKGSFTGAHSDKPGLFVVANRGTIFLDEIGETSLTIQAKLLHVLDTKRIRPVGGTTEVDSNARVIAATNQDLRQLVAQKKFREDLYYRLAVIPITLPPLRKRPEDIPLLVEHLLAKVAQEKNEEQKRVTGPLMADLIQFPWRGNIRELENMIRWLYVMYPTSVEIGINHVESYPSWRQPKKSRPPALRRSAAVVLSALEEAQGNKSAAARKLGIGRMQMQRILKNPHRLSFDGIANPGEVLQQIKEFAVPKKKVSCA